MRTVYFIGAGFTKALEHRRPVPLMMNFVQVLARHARRNDVCLMTLIGLEAMNVFRHRQPSLRSLASGLWPKRHRRRLVDGALARPPESIETLLTRSERLDAQIAARPLSGKTLFAAINDPELRVEATEFRLGGPHQRTHILTAAWRSCLLQGAERWYRGSQAARIS